MLLRAHIWALRLRHANFKRSFSVRKLPPLFSSSFEWLSLAENVHLEFDISAMGEGFQKQTYSHLLNHLIKYDRAFEGRLSWSLLLQAWAKLLRRCVLSHDGSTHRVLRHLHVLGRNCLDYKILLLPWHTYIESCQNRSGLTMDPSRCSYLIYYNLMSCSWVSYQWFSHVKNPGAFATITLAAVSRIDSSCCIHWRRAEG